MAGTAPAWEPNERGKACTCRMKKVGWDIVHTTMALPAFGIDEEWDETAMR